MYLELFKLHELPFRLTPDPQFLYLSKHHARAKAYMESTIWFTDGFVVITGEIGSGKTTLIETFLKELEKDVVVAQINQTQVSAIEFLQTVLVQFGFQPFRMKKAELLSTLNEFLVEQYANGRRVLLIVDEAQNLSNKVLEEIRLLSGVETTKEKVLRIILAGQPELNDKLNSPMLIQLAQRIRLRFHLTALSKTDTSLYIQHRLEVAGSQGRQIFDPETLSADLPLHRRHPAPGQHAVRHLDDGRVRAGPRRRHGRGHESGDRGIAVGRVRRALGQAARAPLLCTCTCALHLSIPQGERRVTLGRILVGFNGQTIAERELTPGRFIIGRTPDNDLQIDSKYISRHHAQIITTGSTSVLEDLNSTNGIYVRAKRVRRRMLNDGDVVQIGQHEIMYFDERLSRTRALSGEGDDDAVPLVQDVAQDRKQQTADTDEDEDDAVAPIPIRADRK